MAWTDIPAVVNGVDSPSASDFNTYVRDNLNYLAAGHSAFVEISASSYPDSTAGELMVGPSVGGDNTAVWDTSSILYELGTNAHMDLDQDSPGFWYVGGTLKYGADNSGDRRFELTRQSSLDVVRWRSKTTRDDRTARMSAGTATEFTSSNYTLDLTGFQTSGSTLTVEGDIWAAWLGDSGNTSVASIAQTYADENTSPAAWWNNFRDNMIRLRNRPAARVYRSVNQNPISTATFTKLAFETELVDNASMVDSDESRITAQFDGFYYLSAGVVMDAYTGSADQLIIQFRVNGSSVGSSVRSFDVNTGDASACIESIFYLEDGDYVETWIYHDSGGNEVVEGGQQTFMAAVLVSGGPREAPLNESTRQVFYDGAPSAPAFSSHTSAQMPRGLVNLCGRDLFLHMWNAPVIGVQMAASTESLSSGGWHQLGFDKYRYNNWLWSEVGNDDPGGSIELPMDGVYLAVASVDIPAGTFGNKGDRGMRIKHKNNPLAPIRVRSGTGSTLSWVKTTSTLIRGRKGDPVTVEALSSATETVTEDSSGAALSEEYERAVELDNVSGTLVLVRIADRPS